MSENSDTYWSEIDAALARVPVAPELEKLPLRCTDFADVYAVRLTSIGPYRIFSYLSVPTSGGRHPAVLEAPHYGSVNHVPAYELRQRYVVLTLMHRGQRLADQPFAATYPGLLTLGIDSPLDYVYRGIVADCLRGAEFLFAQPCVDAERVGIVGDDLALLTAARRPRFAAVQASTLLFYRLLDFAARSSEYPVEEINDVLRHSPHKRDAIAATLDLFDPVHHATSIRAATVLAANEPEWMQPLLDSLPRGECYPLTHAGRTDHDWLDQWLADRLTAADPS